MRETSPACSGPSGFRPDTSSQLALGDSAIVPSAPTVADIPLPLAAARQAAYPEQVASSQPSRRLSLPILLLIGLVVFVLFFAVAYFVANAVFPH